MDKTNLPPTPPESELDDYSQSRKTSIETVSFPLPSKTEKPTKVLECDTKTADNHVPRDSRLIRLTGIHPFNCEAPLTALYDSGFLTPTELWYVRNHGAVPKVLDEDIPNWKLTIEGLIENPMTIELNELLKLTQVTLPITLVCAGNRRKEQNIIRKGNGFNWGSAGVSTALFTGVLINELFKLVKPKHEGRYMCMEGADQLPNDYYGTSIRLSIAMDPSMGVMLAHKMNGELLIPDHGRPLRVVIPGQIGGRSVKWLKRIIITENPSNNWYNIYDNRVLPTMLTPEMVDKDKSWWYDERYALFNLNVQSVICYPAHQEMIKIEQEKSYTIRGYAYDGGGLRVGRVEISLDQGQTWKLANIDYPEDRYREVGYYPQLFGGKLDMIDREYSFCWCFWNIEISIIELCQSKDIIVRAMDENMNIQPRDMYWNVLSMLNNCWYRLTITKEQNNDSLIVDHPCVPAFGQGGWMEKVKKEGRNLTDGFWGSASVIETNQSEQKSSTFIKMTDDSITRVITEEELSIHNKAGDAWFAVNGHVYDATEFLKDHPGGGDSIVLASGADASDDFMSIHSDTAKGMLVKYHIGILQTTTAKKKDTTNDTNTKRDVFLNLEQWSKAILKTKKILNHDSVHLTFLLEHSQQKLGVPIGKHLCIRCMPSSDEHVIRPYTPISHIDQLGEFEFVVKLYRACGNRPAGKMSDCIDRLKEGDTVECKGPFGHFQYQSDGITLNKDITRKVDKMTMIAGGSGITPIYQILRYAYIEGIQCDVIYCNKTEDDILLRKELESLKEIRHCLSRPNDGWTGLSGYISQDFIGDRHDGLLLCCGPPGMEVAVSKIAEEGGWDLKNQFILFGTDAL